MIRHPANGTPPKDETWLYENPVALEKIRSGLADAAAGNLIDLGSFEQYAEDEID